MEARFKRLAARIQSTLNNDDSSSLSTSTSNSSMPVPKYELPDSNRTQVTLPRGMPLRGLFPPVHNLASPNVFPKVVGAPLNPKDVICPYCQQPMPKVRNTEETGPSSISFAKKSDHSYIAEKPIARHPDLLTVPSMPVSFSQRQQEFRSESLSRDFLCNSRPLPAQTYSHWRGPTWHDPTLLDTGALPTRQTEVTNSHLQRWQFTPSPLVRTAALSQDARRTVQVERASLHAPQISPLMPRGTIL